MSFRAALLSKAREAAKSPALSWFFYRPSIQGAIQRWPGFTSLYGRGWELLHPFDLANGTETSGFVLPDGLPPSQFSANSDSIYAGSQPSIIRTALKALPSVEGYTFIDTGCGKGRPLLVASEFPFKDLIGVELSPVLAETARKNIALICRKRPGLPPMRVETVDAGAFQFPSGNLVVFFYNPFGSEIMRRVVAGIEASSAYPRSIFVVYYNPVCFSCFDESPAFQRYDAAALTYADEERGFGPDSVDSVVTWQNGIDFPSKSGAGAIVQLNPGPRADVLL